MAQQVVANGKKAISTTHLLGHAFHHATAPVRQPQGYIAAVWLTSMRCVASKYKAMSCRSVTGTTCRIRWSVR
eukprot:1030409-Pelagomonas_calceolata.AAC.1